MLRLDTYICTAKPAILDAFNHTEGFILILCSIGLCLCSLPNISFQMHKNSKETVPFFEDTLDFTDVYNGSYESVLTVRQKRSLMASFLYAKWDADSRESKYVISALRSFSPIELLAVDCWLPSSSCVQSVKLKRFPQITFHLKGFEDIPYRGFISVRHLAEHMNYLLNPVVFLRTKEDISSFLLTFRVVVLGHFNFSKQSSPDFIQFHAASLSVNNLFADSFEGGREIVFAVAPTGSTKLSDVNKAVRIFFQCDSFIMIYKYNATKLLASELLTALQDAFLSIRLSHPQCLRPTDLTPPTQGLQRSNLMHFAFSQSPVLLISGPHLSLAKYVDPILYTIRTLEVSYGACNRLQPPVLPSGNWSYRSLPTGREAHRLLHKPALATYREQRQRSAVCPQWFRHVNWYLEGHPIKVCGDPDYVTAENLIIPEKLDPNFPQQHSVRNSSALFKILDLANDSDFAEKAAIWLRQLSSALDSSIRSSYFPIDAMATVEQLHFTCCRWFHRYSSSSHLNSDLLAPVPPTIPAPSSLDQLACGSNWTLQFHTLDSFLHPELVWKLTGHNATVNPTQFSAVIVDQSAEAIYRLEEPVSYESLSQFISDYHASVLKPWWRHSSPRPSGSNPGHGSRPLSVTEIRSRSHLDHLLDERSHIHWATQASNTCCAHTSLILLYYTEACVFASQGESALWHFDVVARQFSTQARLLFAKVDVSAVDLPWHLRVERVPSIIFFPASRSSYSIPFPSASMITHDLSSRLSNFLREQIGLPCVTVRTLDVDKTSLSARKHLLNILQSDLNMIPTEELAHQLHSVCHNDSSTSSSIKRLTTCQNSVRAVTSDYTTKYKHAQRTASALLRYLYVNLNDLNSRLVSPFYRMLYATRGHQIHLIDSLMFQSDLWNNVHAFERNVSNLLRLFSVNG